MLGFVLFFLLRFQHGKEQTKRDSETDTDSYIVEGHTKRGANTDSNGKPSAID
jgi:hypothetical protein